MLTAATPPACCWCSGTHHHPVLGVDDVHRPFGLSLDGLVDDATGHAVDQEDADEASLLVIVCALGHHGKKVRVQVLQENDWNAKKNLKTSLS